VEFKVAFIGGGNMATALIGGMLKKGWPPENLSVVEIDAGARERVERDLGVAAHETLEAGIASAECITLAVKPQSTREVASAVAAHAPGKLVLTIAAGIRVRDLARWLGGHSRIVRAMPNTPALALAGMTGLYASAEVGGDDRARAEAIMSAAGSTLWVDDESRIDAITAISGSGPAYVFYFLESLEQAAAKLGFDPQSARTLALQTFAGAVKLAAESPEAVSTLRARVTSKGGTTERALATLDARGVRDAIIEAAAAAAERSRELGEALGGDSTTGVKPA
jgi:pyrroline-5-carboxylate reductase